MMNDTAEGGIGLAGAERKKKRHNWSLTLMALPGILVLIAVSYVPLTGLVIPFKQIDYSKGIYGSSWAKPLYKNFEFFFRSNDAIRVIANTVIMNLLFIFVTLAVSVSLALCMYELHAGAVKLYQTCLFVPYFISWVVASYIVYALLTPDMGVIPNIFMRFGLKNGREMTQKEVADLMGISQSYISRLEKRIIGKLREEMLKLA